MADSNVSAASDEKFEDTPKGWRQRWIKEFDAARKEHKDWQEKGVAIVDRYLDKRKGDKSLPDGVSMRWNIFTSGVQTKHAMLYGKAPTVDVRPKFSDAPDSVARVAGEIAERLLNSDIERDEDGFKDALDDCLMDRLLPGIAFIRFRYVSDWEEVDGKPARVDETGRELAPAIDAYKKKAREEVETDYVYWLDVLWSPCRTFRDMRWCAFRNSLTREKLEEKFGEDVAKKIALESKKESTGTDSKQADPWGRADVWEIWDKEHECVWFFVEGHSEVLKPVDLDDAAFNPNGSQKDPLGLKNFWPFAKPLIANRTTSAFVPRADWIMAQDIADEVDRVTTAITDIARAIGPKGVYDKTATDSLGNLLTEASNGKMYPVENWAALMERGGINGAFQLLDLAGLAAALDKLREYRQELLQAYYQITGDSDLSRGNQIENGTPGEAQVKARFASVRMQKMQDEFAKFVSENQAVRLEIIFKQFDTETILSRANMEHSFDGQDPQAAQTLTQAVELLKSDTGCYRVEVKPENVSMDDFAQLRAERTEVITAISTFIQTAAPLAGMMPGSSVYLLEMLQWLVSGLRGASTIQGVLDKAIAAAQQAQKQAAMQPQQAQPPDPKLLANQQKAQADIQKIQAQTQSEMLRMNAETQQLAQRKLFDSTLDVKEAAAKKAIQNGTGGPGPLLPPGVGGGMT